MRYAIASLVLLAVFGLIVNTGRQIYFWLKIFFRELSPFVFGLLFGLTVLAIVGVYIFSRFPNLQVPIWIFRLNHYALGLLANLILYFNLFSIVHLSGRILHLIPVSKLSAVRAWTGSLAMLLVIGLFAYGSIHALTIHTKHYTVRIRSANATGVKPDPLRVVLISDLHLGQMIGEKHLEKVMAAARTSKPDIVLIAGDVFDGDATALQNPQKQQELFRELNRLTRFGSYAVLGNHDAGKTHQAMLRFLTASDIRVLQDEAVVIDQNLILLGRKDSSPIGDQGEPRKKLDEIVISDDLPIVVLDHQPGNIREYDSRFDLILSGHTHRGQIFPANLITRAIYDVDYGYYQADPDSPQVIVSSGAGTWGPPQRIGSDNEIALIEITFE